LKNSKTLKQQYIQTYIKNKTSLNGFLFKLIRSYNTIVICFKPKFTVETEVANNASSFYLLITLKGVKVIFFSIDFPNFKPLSMVPQNKEVG
jgi:hypothetical protein